MSVNRFLRRFFQLNVSFRLTEHQPPSQAKKAEWCKEYSLYSANYLVVRENT